MRETLSFSIYGQYLKRVDVKTIANKSKNILECKFNFKTDIWNEVDKFALFKNRTDTYSMHLGTGNVVDCIVPWEVLKGKYFKVTVYGGDLITTNEVTIPLVKSGYTDDITPTREPTKDVFIEIFESLDNKIDEIKWEDDSIKCYSNGKLKDVINLPFVTEDELQELIQNIVTKTEMEAFLSEKGYIKNFDFNFATGEITFEK